MGGNRVGYIWRESQRVRLNSFDPNQRLTGKIRLRSRAEAKLGTAWEILTKEKIIENGKIDLNKLMKFYRSKKTVELMGKYLVLRSGERDDEFKYVLTAQIKAIVGRTIATGLFVSIYGKSHQLAIRTLGALEREDVGSFNTLRADLFAEMFNQGNYGKMDLSGLDLSGMDLDAIKLLWVNLRGANLKGTQLRWAEITAELERANFESTDLREATFKGSSFSINGEFEEYGSKVCDYLKAQGAILS